MDKSCPRFRGNRVNCCHFPVFSGSARTTKNLVRWGTPGQVKREMKAGERDIGSGLETGLPVNAGSMQQRSLEPLQQAVEIRQLRALRVLRVLELF